MALVGYLIPIPEEIMLLVVGYTSAFGFNNVYIVLIVSIVALQVGDMLFFWLSKGGSKYVVRFIQQYSQKMIQHYEQLMKNNAGKTIFLLRFVIGMRILSPVLAGWLNIRWTTFLIYDTLALIIYASVLIFLGFYFHSQLFFLISELGVIRHIIFLIFITALGIGIIMFVKKKYVK